MPYNRVRIWNVVFDRDHIMFSATVELEKPQKEGVCLLLPWPTTPGRTSCGALGTSAEDHVAQRETVKRKKKKKESK